MTPHRHLPRGLAVNMLQQLASQTPTWVWLLPAILVTRGIAAMKPGEVLLASTAATWLRGDWTQRAMGWRPQAEHDLAVTRLVKRQARTLVHGRGG